MTTGYRKALLILCLAAPPLWADGIKSPAPSASGEAAKPVAASSPTAAGPAPVAAASAPVAVAPAPVAAAPAPAAAAPAPVAATPAPAAAAPAPQGSPVPAAVPAGQKAADPAFDGQLREEVSKLQQLEDQLKAIESVPLRPLGAESEEPLPADKAQEKKPEPGLTQVPKEPLKGLEEEFANALYALRKYDSASAAYRKLLESKPKVDVQAWARFQIANCAKRAGDFPAAAAAYEDLLTTSPACPWAPEAAWWANEIKWRMRWEQTAR